MEKKQKHELGHAKTGNNSHQPGNRDSEMETDPDNPSAKKGKHSVLQSVRENQNPGTYQLEESIPLNTPV